MVNRPLQLHALPTELLHNVFELLEIVNVLAMRRTCRIMALVGLDHFGSEVPLAPHKDKFRALTEIAKHPVLSTRMRSFFYVIDRVTLTDQSIWESNWDMKDYNMEWNPAASEILRTICADQEDVLKSGYDADCLRQLFPGCQNIRDVTVEYGANRKLSALRTLNASHTAYGKVVAIASPGKGSAWASTAAREVLNVADAVASSGVQLDSLTLVGATYQLWDPDLRSEKEAESLDCLVQPLRRLLLDIQTERDDEYIRPKWPD